MSIPVRFREELQKHGNERLYITNFIYRHRRCLVLYPPNEWERLVGRLKQKPIFDQKMQDFQMYFIGGAHEVEVDRQGRILIPPTLRRYASIDKNVTFSALVDHFTLWDKDTWEEVLLETERNIETDNFFSDLGL